jgi:hypothetical protein
MYHHCTSDSKTEATKAFVAVFPITEMRKTTVLIFAPRSEGLTLAAVAMNERELKLHRDRFSYNEQKNIDTPLP